MKVLLDWLVLCVWRALIGEIYPSIRAIALSLVDDRTLLICYYLDRQPTDFDWGSLEVVATNISASIGQDKMAKTEGNVVNTFTTQFGKFEVRESLFMGSSGKAANFQSTFHVLEDGTRKLSTIIPIH